MPEAEVELKKITVRIRREDYDTLRQFYPTNYQLVVRASVMKVCKELKDRAAQNERESQK